MTTTTPAVAHVGGQPLHRPGDRPDEPELRQRACTELLRQAAQRAGLLHPDDRLGEDGVPSEAASAAIEKLLEQQLKIAEPDDEACRRHHAARVGDYRLDERVRARHILFAVTPGVDLAALRGRAEQVLLQVRCDASGELFARLAAESSNCPSGRQGGDLGWLCRSDCAPEFAREIFGRFEIGVLPRLVHSRYGLHVVEIEERDPGRAQPFEEVRESVRSSLRHRGWIMALRHYLMALAAGTTVEGVQLDGADSPLVQ